MPMFRHRATRVGVAFLAAVAVAALGLFAIGWATWGEYLQ